MIRRGVAGHVRRHVSGGVHRPPDLGELFDLRMSCLDGHRATFRALLDSLPASSVAQVEKVAASPLPPIAECGITERLSARPLPADPGRRARWRASTRCSRSWTLLGRWETSPAPGAWRPRRWPPPRASATSRCKRAPSTSWRPSSSGASGFPAPPRAHPPAWPLTAPSIFWSRPSRWGSRERRREPRRGRHPAGAGAPGGGAPRRGRAVGPAGGGDRRAHRQPAASPVGAGHGTRLDPA